MANFMCQPDRVTGSPDIWLNISGCVCDGVSGRDQCLNQWLEYRRSPSPMWVGITQSVEDLTRTGRGGELNFLSLYLTA